MRSKVARDGSRKDRRRRQEVSVIMTRRTLRWATALSLAIALPASAVYAADPWWVIKPRPNPTAPPSASIGRPVAAASLGKPVGVPTPPADSAWNPPASPVAEVGWNVPSTPAPAQTPFAPPPLSAQGWDGRTTAVSYDVGPDGSMPPRLAARPARGPRTARSLDRPSARSAPASASRRPRL